MQSLRPLIHRSLATSVIRASGAPAGATDDPKFYSMVLEFTEGNFVTIIGTGPKNTLWLEKSLSSYFYLIFLKYRYLVFQAYKTRK